MKVVTIEEEGRTIHCHEGDFIYLDQMLEDAIEILKPYSTPVALQYMKMARQLIAERRQEIFNQEKKEASA